MVAKKYHVLTERYKQFSSDLWNLEEAGMMAVERYDALIKESGRELQSQGVKYHRLKSERNFCVKTLEVIRAALHELAGEDV